MYGDNGGKIKWHNQLPALFAHQEPRPVLGFGLDRAAGPVELDATPTDQSLFASPMMFRHRNQGYRGRKSLSRLREGPRPPVFDLFVSMSCRSRLPNQELSRIFETS